MTNFKVYKIPHLKGAIGNTEWWTQKDWENHQKYVEELKSKGEYLQEEIITFYVKPFPEFDDK